MAEHDPLSVPTGKELMVLSPPSPPMASVKSLSQKEWMKVIHQCLVFLSQTNPPPESNLFKEERQRLPEEFYCSNLPVQFCYSFKGLFLPSGNQDGRVWKPSQGARPAGDGLMKRYFYYKENEVKIKRQVIWLADNENWCFLDYRYNFKGKIKPDQIMIPPYFNFQQLLALAEQTSTRIPPQLSEKKRKMEQFSSVSDNGHFPALTEVPTLDLAPSFNANLELSSERHHSDVWEDLLETPVDFDFETFGLESLGEQECTLTPLLDYCKVEKHESGEVEEMVEHQHQDQQLAKRQKIMDATPIPAAAVPNCNFFSFSPFDYLFNHLLSYDQVLDTICQNICTQLISNRKCLQLTGMDPNSLLQTVIQKSSLLQVDLREFPGQLVSNFLAWVCESFNRALASIPPIYCIVCGCGGNHHDEDLHIRFYNQLDQGFVSSLQEKAKNLFDLVKELLAYLLRFPNSRQSFQETVQEHFHCPFCAGKNGEHCPERHSQWAALLSLDTDSTEIEEPQPTDNLDTYTNSTFEYLMGRMPFHIPYFLLNLSNVQTFLDCLVKIWKSIRLV